MNRGIERLDVSVAEVFSEDDDEIRRADRIIGRFGE